MDLATTHDIYIVPFSNKEIETIEKTFPFFSKWIIPKDTYKGQTQDVQTIAVWNSIVCHKDMP